MITLYDDDLTSIVRSFTKLDCFLHEHDSTASSKTSTQLIRTQFGYQIRSGGNVWNGDTLIDALTEMRDELAPVPAPSVGEGVS